MKKVLWILGCLCLTVSLQAQKKVKKPDTAKKPATTITTEPVVAQTPLGITEKIQSYRFDEAAALLQRDIAAARKKQKATIQLEAQLKQCQTGINMLHATEKVVFIDSFVVDKDKFLSAYKLGKESGTLMPYSEAFPNDNELSAEVTRTTVYVNELGDKMYYAYPNEGGILKLFTRSKLKDEWSEGEIVRGLDNRVEEQAFPFVLSDGVTLYYAAQGGESIGGYDIFVTRYNADTKTFLRPENIGFPFNSPANDYLYAVDELNQIGWFVTDRNQPADKVCVYLFIPTVTRDVYDYTPSTAEMIRDAARIHSIAATWTDKGQVDSALDRLKASVEKQAEESKKHADFYFIVNNTTTYTHLNQFANQQARNLAENWVKHTNRFKELERALSKMRETYAATTSQAERTAMTASILTNEKELEKLQATIHAEEKNIRAAENSSIKTK